MRGPLPHHSPSANRRVVTSAVAIAMLTLAVVWLIGRGLASGPATGLAQRAIAVGPAPNQASSLPHEEPLERATAFATQPAVAEARAIETSPPVPVHLGDPNVHSPIVQALDAAAALHGLDPFLLRAVAWVESSYRPAVRSSAGAIGLMQLMPRTVDDIEDMTDADINPLTIQDNADAGAAYLAHLIDQSGDVETALASYHEGPAAVATGGPSESSRTYVARVLHLQQDLAAHLGEPATTSRAE